jgi:hypothetical protein
MTRRQGLWAVAVTVAAVTAACGDDAQRPKPTTAANTEVTGSTSPVTTPQPDPTTPQTNPANPATSAGATSQGGTVYRTVASAIQAGDGPPMIAFALRESFPPQGGDVVLHGFSWDDVDGEQSSGGTTWLDGIEFVGRPDGTGGFVLTQPARPGEAPLSALTYDAQTDGCAESTYGPMLTTMAALDTKRLGILATSEYTFDGHCGVAITAQFDIPELRTAVDEALGAGADASYDFMFLPLTGSESASTTAGTG